MEFRSIGDAFEDHEGNLEFFSKSHHLTKIHYFPCGQGNEDLDVIFFETTRYDHDNGDFSTDNLDIPLRELRRLNALLIQNGIEVI